MKSVFTVLAILLTMSVTAMAQQHTKCEAAATDFAIHQMGINNPQLTLVEIKNCPHIHAFNIASGGFVITCEDSRTRSVLGYAHKGQLSENQLSPATLYWLNEYEHQIAQLGNTTLQELTANYQGESKPTYPSHVTPLITSTWNQSGLGYNSMVPIDTTYALDSTMNHFDGHPTVGCGALAAAQIMRYWQFPQHGYGSHCYSQPDEPCWRYGTLCVNFGETTYDYALMPDRLTDSSSEAEVAAVATLMYHCGVACNMNYNSDCRGSSGSSITSNLFGLQTFFHYDNNAYYDMRHYHSESDWTNMLKNELSNLRPIYYCGQSYRNENEGTLDGGHAFVCDGYDSNDFFHFNWGWGGYADGFFALNVLRPMTSYNFTSFQYCMFNLQPSFHPQPVMIQGSDLTMHRSRYPQGDSICGEYSITNIGDTLLNIYVGVNIYGATDQQYYGCVDGRLINLEPGDTIQCEFSYPLNLPLGHYIALMQYSNQPMFAGNPLDESMYYDDGEHVNSVTFEVSDSTIQHYTNLALFVRFADDPAFSSTFQQINSLFNGTSNSVLDFYHKISYDKIDYRTIYTSESAAAQQVIEYVDIHPRGYYQPYSPSNPIGYTGENPMYGISMREAQLIARICRYVDSLDLVNANVDLDGNYDGMIDNVSFVIQGMPGNWADLLWPHMEFFPHDSVGYTVTINGKRINAFNFEFEGDPNYFTLRTFAHELGHSLNLPDLYHYYVATDIVPTFFDVMGNVLCHPSAIYKHKILHITDKPTEITTSGTYSISSLGSSPTNNLYYIRSQMDTNQWYTIEYRNNQDPYEENINHSGLIIGRWMDTVSRSIYLCGNSEYNGNDKPNTYWVFRPGSNNDAINGSFINCVFDFEESCPQEFGPRTNPHPYLADGTPEEFFLIDNIQTNGTFCFFSVDFIHTHSITNADPSNISIYPNPATLEVSLHGVAANTPIKIYTMIGQLQLNTIYNGQSLDISALPAGVYILSTPTFNTKLIKSN